MVPSSSKFLCSTCEIKELNYPKVKIGLGLLILGSHTLLLPSLGLENKKLQYISVVLQSEVMIVRSSPGRKHSCQTQGAQVSLSPIRLPGRGKQVQDPSEHALSPSTLIRGQAISAPQVQGGAYSGEVILKRVNTVPLATLQETDQLLAQQLLRDHSPLGLAAVFAVTV